MDKSIRTLIVVGLVLILVSNSFAAPLIFKARKVIEDTDNLIELGAFDTGKVTKIRISVKGEIERQALSETFKVIVYSVEDGAEIYLMSASDLYSGGSWTFDTLPARVIVKIITTKKGVFTLQVWGQ